MVRQLCGFDVPYPAEWLAYFPFILRAFVQK